METIYEDQDVKILQLEKVKLVHALADAMFVDEWTIEVTINKHANRPAKITIKRENPPTIIEIPYPLFEQVVKLLKKHDML